VVFSGDTTANDDLIALAQGAEILVYRVADLGYLQRHGWAGAALDRMAGLHADVTEVGAVAERAGVGELILTHYLPAEPGATSERHWVERAALGFSGRTSALRCWAPPAEASPRPDGRNTISRSPATPRIGGS
jgi:ribonuclease BN (tRNA processing enzyme)